MNRVLVTGGAGYIGSHTAKTLAGQGFEPVVFDNLSAGHRWAVQWGPFVEGDLGDIDLLKKVIKDYRIEAVLHFAAHAYVGESMKAPERYFRNNVINTLHLLEAMLACGVDQMVFSSTCATYGVPRKERISESDPQHPVNPYGESKLFIEKALSWHSQAHNLRSVSLRYFNAAGADPEGEIGESHTPETHLIPLVIEASLGQRDRVEVFGTDYDTPDGTAVRDYIHVMDLAAAHVLALRHLLNGGPTAAFNLGTGRGYSVQNVIECVESVSGQKVPVRKQPKREGDPPALVAEASKAAQTLGWKPKYKTLEPIIETAYSWHASRCAAAVGAG